MKNLSTIPTNWFSSEWANCFLKHSLAFLTERLSSWNLALLSSSCNQDIDIDLDLKLFHVSSLEDDGFVDPDSQSWSSCHVSFHKLCAPILHSSGMISNPWKLSCLVPCHIWICNKDNIDFCDTSIHKHCKEAHNDLALQISSPFSIEEYHKFRSSHRNGEDDLRSTHPMQYQNHYQAKEDSHHELEMQKKNCMIHHLCPWPNLLIHSKCWTLAWILYPNILWKNLSSFWFFVQFSCGFWSSSFSPFNSGKMSLRILFFETSLADLRMSHNRDCLRSFWMFYGRFFVFFGSS